MSLDLIKVGSDGLDCKFNSIRLDVIQSTLINETTHTTTYYKLSYSDSIRIKILVV